MKAGEISPAPSFIELNGNHQKIFFKLHKVDICSAFSVQKFKNAHVFSFPAYWISAFFRLLNAFGKGRRKQGPTYRGKQSRLQMGKNFA